MSPDEFLALAGTSIIKTGLLRNTTVYGIPELVGFGVDPIAKGEMADGKGCPVLNLSQNGQTDRIKVYVCDYHKNELGYQVLGKDADFCFTITMNGCTFGIGSPTPDGSVLVTHGNRAEAGQNQAGEQLGMGQFFHAGGAGTTFIQPADYLAYSEGTSGKANISTFGLRVANKWKFYYQRYAALGGGRMRHLGVSAVSTTSVSG